MGEPSWRLRHPETDENRDASVRGWFDRSYPCFPEGNFRGRRFATPRGDVKSTLKAFQIKARGRAAVAFKGFGIGREASPRS